MAAQVGSNTLGLDSDLFTRGKAGQTDNVGVSMVQRHAERMQQEKEANALQKLAVLLPQLGFFTRVMALREMDWDVDKALVMLRQFQSENEVELKALRKKRKKVQAELQAQQEKDESGSRSSGASESGSGSSDADGSDSDSGRKRKDKKKDSKKRKRSSKDKKKKKQAKDKAPKPPSGVLTHSEDFGKFGIIRESDAYAKRNEFILWALDVRKVDVENLGKWDERDLFKEFMEDYNTGTLPHRKYYDLDAYERAMAAKAAAKGLKHTTKPKALNDEEELRRQRDAERERLAQERLEEAYKMVKRSNLGQDMREQDMLRKQMEIAYKTGDVTTARRLAKRLEKDDPSKPKKR